MLNTYNIAELLEFKDAIVTKIEKQTGIIKIYIEMPRKEHKCPNCGIMTDTIHDYRIQTVKDIDIQNNNTILKYRKRRYRCPVCGKRFYEENPIVKPRQRNTQRLFVNVLNDFRSKMSATDISRRYNISVTTSFRYLEILGYGCTKLPEVISIDEFKGNSGGEKYLCAIADGKNKKLLDILPNRKENDMIKYFLKFSNREDVKVVSIDMNGHFDRIARICFPNAVIVADRFHVVRQVIWALENVRKKEQKSLSEKFRKYFKRSKGLLLKSIHALSDDEKDKLSLMLEISPKLADAYYLKNKFMEAIHSGTYTEARKNISDWIFTSEVLNIPEFMACTRCYHNWFKEILNSYIYPYNNGFIEGCNNKIKVIKRISFGMKNFNHFKIRILHAS